MSEEKASSPSGKMGDEKSVSGLSGAWRPGWGPPGTRVAQPGEGGGGGARGGRWSSRTSQGPLWGGISNGYSRAGLKIVSGSILFL